MSLFATYMSTTLIANDYFIATRDRPVLVFARTPTQNEYVFLCFCSHFHTQFGSMCRVRVAHFLAVTTNKNDKHYLNIEN